MVSFHPFVISCYFCSCLLFLAAFGHPWKPFLQIARVQPLAGRSPEPLRLARQCLVAPDVLHQEPPTEFVHGSTSLRRGKKKQEQSHIHTYNILYICFTDMVYKSWNNHNISILFYPGQVKRADVWFDTIYFIDSYSQVDRAYSVLYATRT